MSKGVSGLMGVLKFNERWESLAPILVSVFSNTHCHRLFQDELTFYVPFSNQIQNVKPSLQSRVFLYPFLPMLIACLGRGVLRVDHPNPPLLGCKISLELHWTNSTTACSLAKVNGYYPFELFYRRKKKKSHHRITISSCKIVKTK